MVFCKSPGILGMLPIVRASRDYIRVSNMTQRDSLIEKEVARKDQSLVYGAFVRVVRLRRLESTCYESDR